MRTICLIAFVFGSLSAIGIAAGRRFGVLPDIPVLDEAGIPLAAVIGRGLAVPAGTPSALIDTLTLRVKPDNLKLQVARSAVASLITVAEWGQGRERVAPRAYLYRHIRGIALTSLVASLATLPFAMFYFGRATHYAVLGNLLAMPVMGLMVMPFAAVSVLGMPFGLEHAPLQAMAGVFP